MADKILNTGGMDPVTLQQLTERWVDNGDGTFSRKLASTGGGGGPATIADGAAVTIGAVADATYVSGSGSLVAILKGLFGRLRGGQATLANSLPVAIASDQTGVPIQGAPGTILETNGRLKDGFGQAIRGVTITGGIYQIQINSHEAATYLNVASAAMNLGASGGTQTYADYQVNNIGALLIDFNVTAVSGTNPTLQILIDRKGADGVYYNIYASTASGAIAATSADVGLGAATNKGLGGTIRARAIITGTVTPIVTFSMSIQAVS